MFQVIVAAIFSLFLLQVPAHAQLRENADGWAQMRIGGKICFAEHEHYGESPPWPSKRGARAYAIRTWENFTSWEYGKRWGSYRRAVAKRLTCNRASGKWVCSTTARPCRRR
ncbi:MAG: hypothetical protein ACR2PA_09385 [Hyphomicrobiaceae bacterium]